MIQIAFAGHNRAQELGQHREVSAALTAAFELFKAAGVHEARLLTGLAVGADRLAAEAWRRAQLGPIHAVFPYLDDPASTKIGLGGLAESATWLDGLAAEAQGRNAHLKQTRMIVEAADLVVVVWSGEPAKGAGGTADAVLSALEVGLPVLWIKPAEPHPLRLIRPENLPSDFHFPEFQEALHGGRLDHVEIATQENFRDVIGLTTADPEPEAEPIGAWRSVLDKVLQRTAWRTYARFRKILGGRVDVAAPNIPLPESLATQPGFTLLTAAYLTADRIANRLSAIHRSEQLLIVLAMIAAAFVGSSAAIWPEFKVTSVWIELTLSVAALLVWATASNAKQHERWSEQRYLAERLRLARAGWAVGIGIAGPASAMPRLQAGRGRSTAPAAGLPHGSFDSPRVRSWGDWAMSELVQGQAAYHHAIAIREGRIAHRLHLLEDASLLFLFVVFALYVSLYSAGAGAHLPHWISGGVTMTGTVVPALAAASIALEAKLEFQEQSTRSQRIATALDDLAQRLGPEPSFDALQDIGRVAVRLHLAESSQWREGASRRRLLRP